MERRDFLKTSAIGAAGLMLIGLMVIGVIFGASAMSGLFRGKVEE